MLCVGICELYTIKMSQEHLDNILIENKAQPVGSGYIDIIVNRENYSNLVRDLIENEFEISTISWWEWCEKDDECNYGLGGPKSDYYDGWFAEIPSNVDDLKLGDLNHQESIEKVIKLIESKTIDFSDEKVNFKTSNWMTPGLWLNVPNKWKNKKSV